VLEGDGYVHREARPVVPPHVEYSLTPDGEEVTKRLLALMSFVADRALTDDGDRT
jgi:DNA-binding HxlR family transcriptional regulator